MTGKNSKIDLEKLKTEANSFLSLRPDDYDPVLHKLETYRLRKCGVPVKEIADAFGLTRQYLYEIWRQFEKQGTAILVNDNKGTEPHKLTEGKQAAIIRAKAIDPQRSDADLAKEFGLSRVSVYRLLKKYGIQDLHKIVNRRHR